ncbi:MAG: molybdopterin molybdotransferase MoeA [Gemmataceae bacterium]|nr:molybdopterin molybdotransferase MoeA [Gemmataceae bacterium]MDW8242544.1 molybdopterin molybdotransferase MoeA [Thermogemmata sp.]
MSAASAENQRRSEPGHPMLEVAQAQEIVLGSTASLPAVDEMVSPQLVGRILAEDVVAERDIPAFDKSLRDGYAVYSGDCSGQRPVVLRVVGEIAAGAAPGARIGRGECQRIYTGAPLPAGADAVVMQEDVDRLDQDQVRVRMAVQPGQWVYPRGQEMRMGETVLAAGTRLSAAALGVLASLGRHRVRVVAAPRVGIVATGNELLRPDQPWVEGKIYNSNGPMLEALAASMGLPVINYGILQDDAAALQAGLSRMLDECTAVIIAGGMSVGAYDLVPRVLHTLGVSEQIRQVRMKPGKPFLFGQRAQRLVFGLPGNPASAWTCFHLFVRPALRRLMGYSEDECYPPSRYYPISQRFAASNDRPTYHPARQERSSYGERIQPLPWSGAPDLRSLCSADALLVLPPGQVHYEAGQRVEVLLVDEP